MKKFISKSLLSFSLIYINSLYAQTGLPADKLLPNIMSPEAASLGKYGSYNVNYYSGSPNISVPIHEIREHGVNIPILVNYDASGFVPNKNAGVVGLNWNLVAGGAITRVVNGRPDDSYDPNPVISPDPFGYDKGYIYGQLQANLPHYTAEEIRKIDFLVEPNPGNKYRNDEGYSPKYYLQYEYAPDVFTFNFLGHSGKFFVDNNGQVQVSSDKRYKVDLSGLSPIYDFKTNLGIFSGNTTSGTLNNNHISKIVLTSDDGYEFTFGGAFKDIEVQFDYSNPANREVDSRTGVINAWFITKVKTPTGAEILFKNKGYSDDDAVVIKKLFDQSGSWDNIPGGFLEIKIFRNQIRKYVSNGGSTDNFDSGDQFFRTLIKHCYLEEIKTELQTARFTYGEKDQVNRFYLGAGPVFTLNGNYFTKKISAIEIYDNFNGGGIPASYQPFANAKNVSFGYINKPAVNGTGNRLFLQNVTINNTTYSFVYTNIDNLPDPITKGIDLWGFYNGKDDNTSLVSDPQQSFGVPGEYEVDLQSPGRDRRAYADVALNGMLHSITYPTGGKTEFTFENHEYSKILKRKVSSGIVPVWETGSGIAGGLRIKEIKNIPGMYVVKTK